MSATAKVSGFDISTQYVGITEAYALQSWCRSVAGDEYNVTFSDDVTTAMIYRRDITFPRPTSNMTLRDAIRMRGFMVHETSHPMYQPDYADVTDKYKINLASPQGMVWNVLMDCHAESCRARQWPGDAKALSEFSLVTGRDLCDSLLPVFDNQHEKPIDPGFWKLATVLVCSLRCESTWNVGMRLGFAPLIAALPKDVVALGDECVEKFNLMDRLLSYDETAESLWFLSQELYNYIWKPKPPPPESDSSGSDSSGGKGNDKKKKESGGEKTKNDDANDSGNDSDDDEKDDDEEDEEEEDEAPPQPVETGASAENSDEKAVVKVTQLLLSNHHENENVGNPENRESGLRLDYSEYEARAEYTPSDPKAIKVIDYPKGKR